MEKDVGRCSADRVVTKRARWLPTARVSGSTFRVEIVSVSCNYRRIPLVHMAQRQRQLFVAYCKAFNYLTLRKRNRAADPDCFSGTTAIPFAGFELVLRHEVVRKNRAELASVSNGIPTLVQLFPPQKKRRLCLQPFCLVQPILNRRRRLQILWHLPFYTQRLLNGMF